MSESENTQEYNARLLRELKAACEDAEQNGKSFQEMLEALPSGVKMAILLFRILHVPDLSPGAQKIHELKRIGDSKDFKPSLTFEGGNQENKFPPSFFPWERNKFVIENKRILDYDPEMITSKKNPDPPTLPDFEKPKGPPSETD